ncbi:MAG: FtsX-like permease family protein [Verrucomicrobiales bacterium]|nr:FtsX-like permease family protein [Verrucomicrobiales bacterium]
MNAIHNQRGVGIGGRIRFVGKMAWRDSRASRWRLLLFTLCIVVGIAGLVAVGSLGRSLEGAVEGQAKTLLGADLSIGSRVQFTAEHERFLTTLGGEQAREITFTTMIVFPQREGEGTRLVQVRGLEGGFPFYGRIESVPPEAADRFREQGGVLVEESLLLQFGAKVGDGVKIGSLETRVLGALQKVPGESVAFATIAPRVYLRMEDLRATGLLRDGSLARYRVLFRMPASLDVVKWVESHRTRLDELRLAVATVADRKEDLGQSMRNLYHFLNLVGFVALLLGGVGIASAIQAHVKQKVPTVAVLRCLGSPVGWAFAVYVTQGVALGLVGAVLGAVAGVTIQRLLPRVIADFVPFEVEIATSWSALAEAAALGFSVCVLFALLPLAGIRRVSPLQVLRVAHEPRRVRDPLRVGVVVALAGLVLAFALGHTQRWQEGVGFAAGLTVAFAALAGVARLAMAGLRRLRLPGAPFVVRQGLASVHRPNNRTLLLVVSLGLGTFLLVTLQMSQTTLMRELVSGRQEGRANAILFDIQADQREAVAELVRGQGLPVLDEVPIVTMRLKSIRGTPVEEILASDRDRKGPGWALRREYRSTFTDRLRDSERIVAGEWIGSVDAGEEPVPVSVEDGIAKELGVGMGDELVWDIQGVSLRTRIASLREVDWRRVQPNFFVVFPRGPLDDAPAFHVLVTRVESPEQSARMQREAVRRFPNVSAIDITLVLRTVDQILGKIAYVIRFMALFTVATGLLVLIASVLSGRYQRVRESILLRVLGCSRRQVLRILLVEYTVLGMLSALTGVVLALAASTALTVLVFKLPWTIPLGAPLVSVALVTALTVITGWLASRGITTQAPLEILRRGD